MFARVALRSSSSRAPSLQSCRQFRRHLTQQASPLQETNAVREIHKLMAEVRGAHPQKLKLSMPTRLAPRRSWMKEMQSQHHNEPTTQSTSSELPPSMLEPKRMQDSYVELYLPFTEDPELLEKYIATSGLIRLGKVLEDLDSLAGGISYRHALGGRPIEGGSAPIYIVTASVDRLDLLAPLTADANYRLSGHVIYVGASSMEVFVSIEQLTEPTRPNKICLTGRFTMAARNAHTLKSQRIAPLILETDAERALFAMGESHKNRKRTEAASSLEKVPPSKEEAFLLHSQYIRGLHAGMFATDELHGPAMKLEPAEHPDGPTLVPVRKTSLSTTMHMHPQQRNVHQKIFGGFLMRSAYELAWMASASFVNRHVQFLSLDALSFHAPVPIGAMLQLSSQIAYTSEPAQHPQGHTIASVTVLAEVVDLETGERKKSNTFHFSFDLGQTDRQLLPQTYKEAMEFIEGKRRVEIGAEMRRLYQGEQE
uniref:Acyl-coa thioesterase n=2 Tax=Kalmanozyma brasiliensis (strain GHG001) TaxID=1365824 RepID=V5EPH4_KALBG